jgi:hypothetical protein
MTMSFPQRTIFLTLPACDNKLPFQGLLASQPMGFLRPRREVVKSRKAICTCKTVRRVAWFTSSGELQWWWQILWSALSKLYSRPLRFENCWAGRQERENYRIVSYRNADKRVTSVLLLIKLITLGTSYDSSVHHTSSIVFHNWLRLAYRQPWSIFTSKLLKVQKNIKIGTWIRWPPWKAGDAIFGGQGQWYRDVGNGFWPHKIQPTFEGCSSTACQMMSW